MQDLKHEILRLESEAAVSQEALSAARDEAADLRQRIASLESRTSELEVLIATSNGERDNLSAQLVEKDKDIKDHEEKVAVFFSSLLNGANFFSLQNASLIAEIDRLRAQLDQLNTRNAASQNRIVNLEKEADDLRVAKSDLETQVCIRFL